ncbi:MAG: HEAT repeat domain-containing protein, partial [Myxococcota bacterium]
LIAVFESGNSNARTLVVDLLAQVGHPEAQAALVEVLQGRSARDDAKAVELHQRLSFVAKPEPSTVAYAEQRYEAARRESDDQWHYASAYSLGALARHAGGSTGERLRATLSEGLATASNPVAIRHFVTALGATHAGEAVSQIANYASADDPDVRAAVATTLKAPQSDTAREVLLDLVADDDRLTQHQAIRSLQRHPLERWDLEAIAARVSTGAVYPSNFRALVELAKRFRTDVPEGSAMVLNEMIAVGIPDNQVKAAAHLLLRSLP